jgi:hypothetical protein
MTATTAIPLSVADRLRLERFLLRFSWAMQDYPRKEYLRIRRELRAEVRAAAADVGMRQALADLGHPVTLGERYIAELGRRLPRWTSGIVAGGLAVGVLVYLFAAYAVGTLDTLEALGGGSLTRYPFGTETVFTFTEDEISVLSGVSWQWAVLYLGAAAVAFVVGSRLWRVLG